MLQIHEEAYQVITDESTRNYDLTALYIFIILQDGPALMLDAKQKI